MNILTILVAILAFGLIVFIHELGHFLFAKKAGVRIHEFAIGMGPKIWGTKKGETDYSIRAIPIGGYCALAGEDVEDDDLQKIPEDRRLQAKTPFQRFLIMFFGAGNNFIYAILLLFFVAFVFGGTTMNPTLTGVVRDGAAYNAGMGVGDRVV